MNIYFCIPSARPAAEAQACINEWTRMGYRTAIYRDAGAEPVECDLLLTGEYPGYAQAVNALCKEVIRRDPEAMWMVAGGDDTIPDQKMDAESIGVECLEYFKGTFGVLQPTGDRFAQGSIDRIAGSPWMGREWCERMYGGEGPLYSGYQHMHVDEELKQVAEMLGVYWMRPDLVHLHRHFMRQSEDINSPAVARTPPPHLVRWNSPEHWQESQGLFLGRKSAGFPGHTPLERVTV